MSKDETPPTFARHVNRAFGPDYDPTNFPCWALRNKLPFTWASGVEPFQDVEQARATWDVIHRIDAPVFVQTRGSNWRAVRDRMEAHADQTVLYVSMPSDDPAYVKRFEPGTPPVEERLALVDAAVAAGIPTMVAIAPFHPDWVADAGAYVERLASRGISAILLDPLHLNRRQRRAATDKALIPLADSAALGDAGSPAVLAATEARDACLAAGLSWWCTNPDAPVHRLESVDPFGWVRRHYRDARPFGYVQDFPFAILHALLDDDDAPPLVVEWAEVLKIMEDEGRIDQPFSWSSLGDELLQAKKLPARWQAHLKPTATLADYLRALWNNPARRNTQGGFMWVHPFARLAVMPGDSPGTPKPWQDPDGNLVMVFAPNDTRGRFRFVVEDIEALDRLASEDLKPATEAIAADG